MNLNRKNPRRIIADYIAGYRANNHLTLEAFGSLVGEYKQYIYKLEHCQVNVTVDFLEKLSLATHKELHEIFNYQLIHS